MRRLLSSAAAAKISLYIWQINRMLSSTSPPAAPLRRSPLSRWAQWLVLGVLGLCLAVLAVLSRQARPAPVQRGQVAPDFTLTLFDGYEYAGQTEVSLSELRGKVVLLHFWASWCSLCLEEAPLIQSAWEKYQSKEEVVFLGIAWEDTAPDARAALQALHITYPNGLDLTGKIALRYNGGSGVPVTYLIDRNGVLRHIQNGPFSSTQEIESLLDLLLRE